MPISLLQTESSWDKILPVILFVSCFCHFFVLFEPLMDVFIYFVISPGNCMTTFREINANSAYMFSLY